MGSQSCVPLKGPWEVLWPGLPSADPAVSCCVPGPPVVSLWVSPHGEAQSLTIHNH